MTKTATRQPMTPVEVTSRAYRLCAGRPDLLASKHPEIWAALSTDGLWLYERLDGEPGTPWQVTYLPTGQWEMFGSLPKGRRWTASDRTIPHLRIRAREVIRDGGRTGAVIMRMVAGRLQRVPEDPAECAARVAEAERWLAVLDGHQPVPTP